jgi:hypothetical protein
MMKNTGCEVHHYAIFSTIILLPLGPNILLNSLFSKTISLCSSLKVRDQVSHPYSTTYKITFIDPTDNYRKDGKNPAMIRNDS